MQNASETTHSVIRPLVNYTVLFMMFPVYIMTYTIYVTMYIPTGMQ